jgi:tetratricopeptide (TPR) repeat protein
MDEEQTHQAASTEETGATEPTGTSEQSFEAPGADRPAGGSRWLIQFAVGAVVAGGLVFAFNRRAELSSSVTLVEARRHMQTGHSFQAARELEKVNKEHSGDRAVRVALLEAYYRAGEPEQARPLQNQIVLTPEEEKVIQPLVNKVESSVELLQQGADLLRDNQFAQALTLLKTAEKDMPDSPLPHAYLAKAYAGLYVTHLKEEDLKACQAEQRRLADIDPKLAAEIKKPLGSLEILTEVVKHTNAADAALKAGNPDAATPELDAADKLYPNSAMVHALRAIVHAQRFEKTAAADEKRQALEEYRTAIQLNPTRASMRPRLGKLAAEAGD